MLVPRHPIEIAPEQAPTVYSFEALLTQGILAYINTHLFMPQGFAMSLVDNGMEYVGWTLEGDGREPAVYDQSVEDKLAAAEWFLDRLREREA